METISRISSIVSCSWAAWVLFVLLVLLAINRFFVMDIAVVARGLFSRAERSYVDASWQSKVVSWVYRTGIVSLAAFMCVYVGVENSLMDYLQVLGVIALVLGVRYAIARFVGVVFLDARQVEASFEFRASICNAVTALLWPLLLVARACDDEWVTLGACGVVLLLLLVMLLWKGVQLYCKNVLSVFYILLYTIIIEILPLLVAIFVIKQLLL